MEKSLERLGMPEMLISIIMNLMKNRTMHIHISYGPTEEVSLQRGVDQRDCISLLL